MAKPSLIALILCLSRAVHLDAQAAGETRPRLRADLEGAKARAEANAQRVRRLVVAPMQLELAVGDTVPSHQLWTQLKVVGVTAEGDSINDFAKMFALEPNSHLEQHGYMLVARRPGIATLWVYIGNDTKRPLFVDSVYAERVRITVR